MHQANALESVQHMMRLQDAEASMSNFDFAEAAVVRRVFFPPVVSHAAGPIVRTQALVVIQHHSASFFGSNSVS